jgi:hypothetical protein
MDTLKGYLTLASGDVNWQGGNFVQNVRDALNSLPLPECIVLIESTIAKVIAAHLQVADGDVPVDQPFSSFQGAWRDDLVLWSFLFRHLKDALGLYTYTLDLVGNNSIRKLAEHLAADIDLPPYPASVIENLYSGGSWPWNLPSSIDIGSIRTPFIAIVGCAAKSVRISQAH